MNPKFFIPCLISALAGMFFGMTIFAILGGYKEGFRAGQRELLESNIKITRTDSSATFTWVKSE